MPAARRVDECSSPLSFKRPRRRLRDLADGDGQHVWYRISYWTYRSDRLVLQSHEEQTARLPPRHLRLRGVIGAHRLPDYDWLHRDTILRRRRLRCAGGASGDDARDSYRVPGRVPRGDRVDRFPAVIRVASALALARPLARARGAIISISSTLSARGLSIRAARTLPLNSSVFTGR